MKSKELSSFQIGKVSLADLNIPSLLDIKLHEVDELDDFYQAF